MTDCKAKKKTGEPCQAKSMKGEPFCLWHTNKEAIRQKRLDKSKIGGLKKRKYTEIPTANLINMVMWEPKVLGDVLDIIIRDVYDGNMSPQRGGALVGAIKLRLKVIHDTETVKRLERVEKKLEERKKEY